MLARELSNPKFKEYHIFFSNILPSKDMLQTLADADEKSTVRQVMEVYCDVIAIDPHRKLDSYHRP